MNQQKIYALNEDWLLIDGNQNDDPAFHANGIPAKNAISAHLPCYTHMYIPDHVGISWYEKTFSLPTAPSDKEIALICFEMADFHTQVSVNGIIAGEHYGSEDPFSFDVTRLLRCGENRITVRVSKPHHENVDGICFWEIPHRNQTPSHLNPGACYNASGLNGHVSLHILPGVYMDDLYLIPDVKTGEIRAEITIKNCLAAPVCADLHLEVRHAPEGETEDVVSIPVSLEPGENHVSATLTIPAPLLWDVSDPNLYAVRVCLSSEAGTHSLAKKCGFRTFIVGEDGYFYLNGKRILLRCSHTGNCMPESTWHISRDPALLRRDFLMAKAAGFNALRFISGAALPLQLDLCDEIGLMIYEEPISGWLTQNGPNAVRFYEDDLLTMVKRDRSHPCVTIWGLLNETHSQPPFDQVCYAAKNILPRLRDLDETRLVLFSSGRWDQIAETGSLANPGMREWQNLWGRDGEPDCTFKEMGDQHYYTTTVPLAAANKADMRSFGSAGSKPVFVSETGVGSALDTVSLVRYYDRPDALHHAPDLKMYRQMNQLFLDDLQKYGFDLCIPFPSELMRSSMKNHAYYREQAFDQMRANPKICGISLTGLLDHSICGEGLWTIYRTFKPMMADVLQDGFAPLRWCLFPSAPAIFQGDKLEVEATLASEDMLLPGHEYIARAGLLGPNGYFDVREYRFTPTDEQVRTMVVPVCTESWDTAHLACGEYTFKAEIISGPHATCGIKTIYILPRAHTRIGRKICPVSLTQAQTDTLRSLGYTLVSADEYTPDCVYVAGVVSAETVQKLSDMLSGGAHIVAACGAFPEDHSHEILPENMRPQPNYIADWLYHRETVFRPQSAFLSGMQTGLADALLYTDVITGTHFETEGVPVPDETHAMAFATGFPIARGYMGGFKLAEYHLGDGRLILNTFNLLDSAPTIPYAAQLLTQILDNA